MIELFCIKFSFFLEKAQCADMCNFTTMSGSVIFSKFTKFFSSQFDIVRTIKFLDVKKFDSLGPSLIPKIWFCGHRSHIMILP